MANVSDASVIPCEGSGLLEGEPPQDEKGPNSGGSLSELLFDAPPAGKLWARSTGQPESWPTDCLPRDLRKIIGCYASPLENDDEDEWNVMRLSYYITGACMRELQRHFAIWAMPCAGSFELVRLASELGVAEILPLLRKEYCYNGLAARDHGIAMLAPACRFGKAEVLRELKVDWGVGAEDLRGGAVALIELDADEGDEKNEGGDGADSKDGSGDEADLKDGSGDEADSRGEFGEIPDVRGACAQLS